MTAPRVLLVFPGSLHGGEWAVGPVVKPELVMAWTVLGRAGVEAAVLDLEVEDRRLSPGSPLDPASLLTRYEPLLAGALEVAPPHLVAICCAGTLHYDATMAVGHAVRRLAPETAIAVWGHHPTVRPDDLTGDGTPFELVIQGDGEPALLEAAREAAAGDLADGRGRLARGGPLALTEDNLPDYAGYPFTTRSLPSLDVYVSRGCQYHSANCYVGPGGGRWHGFSPPLVLRLLEDMAQLKPRRIEVLDPAFGPENIWRAAVLEGLSGRERPVVPITITARPESFSRRALGEVYRGRIAVRINVGTLSPTLLRTLDVPRGDLRVAGALELLRFANAKGIPGELDLTFGQPGETRETAAETLDALEMLNEQFPNTSLRVVASRWTFFPYGLPELDVERPAQLYGTQIAHTEWWKEDVDARAAARAVVPSADLADAAPGDDSYWRPRFAVLQAALEGKLTAEARHDLRSHESVGSAAADVPHGFYRQPRWQ